MKLLDRYLMAQFAKNLALVICSLVAIYLLVDFFERVDNFLEAKKTIGLAIKYLLLKLPFMYVQLIPVCILLAGVITLGILNQHFEFMALMAGGISVLRIIRPLLVAAAFFTLLTVAIGQWVLPATTAATNRIWYEEVNKQIPKGIIRDGRTYFRGSEGIFSFVRPNPGKNEFLNHLRATGIFAGKAQEVRLLADPRKKAIEFFSENKEAGSHRSALRAEVEGDSVEVAFNWRFLMEGLVQMRGERVEFALNGEDGAALLRPSEQEGYLYVLMPIKA